MTRVIHHSVTDEDLHSALGDRAPLGVADRQLLADIIRKTTGEATDPVTIGPYTLGASLGQGGMGTVYEAHDDQLGTTVAVKVLRRRWFGESSEQWTRSLREAKAMAEVIHRNIVYVHKVGFSDGQAWISMEIIRGQTLRTWSPEEGSWREVLNNYIQAGHGLAAAHERNVVHGDFKPENILIGADGVPKVTDFGLAVAADECGQFGGTPEYMAPEQYLQGQRSAKSDQFSFCVALFEALTGYHPYSRWTYDELLSTLRAKDPQVSVEAAKQRYRRELFINSARAKIRWPTLPVRIPGRVRAAIVRGLLPEPTERFASMAELLARLDLRRLARRRQAMVGVGALVAVSALAGYGASHNVERNARTEQCAQAPARYAEIWDEATVAQLQDNFSTATANGIGELMERNRQRWLAAHNQGCEATVMAGEWEAWAPIDQCLQSRLDSLDVALEALPQQDPATAIKVMEEMTAPSAAACLLDSGGTTSTDDRVRSIRRGLAAAKLHEVARAYDDGLALADKHIADAKELRYRPLLAEAYYQRGRLRIYQARYATKTRDRRNTPGLDDLERALDYAVQSGHRSIGWDIAIFRARALTILGVAVEPIDVELLLAADDTALLLQEQKAQLDELRGLNAHRRARSESGDEAIEQLRVSIEHFGRALQEQQARGSRIGEARVRSNLARAYTEFGTLKRGAKQIEQANAAFVSAEEQLNAVLDFWEAHAYGQKYVMPLYGMLINAQLVANREAACSRVEALMRRYESTPQMLEDIFAPGMLAFYREPYATQIAFVAMDYLDHHSVPPQLETQLRMFALDAVMRDASVAAHLDAVHSWSTELERQLPTIDARLAARVILIHAQLGHAHLLAKGWEAAKGWLEQARDSAHWEAQTETTKAEILLDLAEVYLELGDRQAAAKADQEAEATFQSERGTSDYFMSTLRPSRARLQQRLADAEGSAPPT